MSKILGYGGSVKAGLTPSLVGEIRNYSITRNADIQDTSTLGSDWASNASTLKRWTATLEIHVDVSDTGQTAFETAFENGATIALEFYQGGESGAGNVSLTGNAVIESIGDTNDVAGFVTASISVTGTGALTRTALT